MTAQIEARSSYVAVASAMAMRVHIAEDALSQVAGSPGNPLAIAACEIATIQLRLLCELILVGSQLAHLEDAGAKISESKWRPKDVFQELEPLSEHPLPVPVEIHWHENGDGSHQINPISKPMPFKTLSMVYGQCGDLLHVPTVKQVLRGNLPEFDLVKLTEWTQGFKRFVQGHVLMLPERQVILLCQWNGIFGNEPQLFRLEAAGRSTLEVGTLPEFDLLA